VCREFGAARSSGVRVTACNSVLNPCVLPAFNFLLDPVSQPSWGLERVLVDRAEIAAKRLQTLAEIPLLDYFLGDPNTPLPGPWREPIKFRYFAHTPNCPNKLSPHDLLDSYDRPLNVRACPHCHGRLRQGESAPNTWCTPLHWDVATQEVFAARPIPRLSRSAYRETLKWVTRPVIEDGVQKVEGWWEERVVPELKSWSTSQESHALDQNYFEPARMQGAVRNNFCIFRVLSDASNNDQISHSYTSRVDEKGNRLTKPLKGHGTLRSHRGIQSQNRGLRGYQQASKFKLIIASVRIRPAPPGSNRQSLRCWVIPFVDGNPDSTSHRRRL
jgi:hypothetical protein